MQIAVAVDLSGGVAQRCELRVAPHHVAQALVRHLQTELARRQLEHAFAHQRIERALLAQQRLDHLRIERGLRDPHPLDLATMRLLELLLRDLEIAHAGHGLAGPDERVVALVDAGQDEGGDDEQQQQELQRAGVPANEIKHSSLVPEAARAWRAAV